MTISSTSSVRSLSSSSYSENSMMQVSTGDLLVRDFGWAAVSPRHYGDHTPESNPDWDHDPLESEEAQKEAFEKMERSYAIYMGNLSVGKSSPKKKASWTKFLPWVR